MPTAFTATFGSGKPVIGLMGEFDALPALSQKDIPTRSPVEPNAPGHACGHNLLGAASALAAFAEVSMVARHPDAEVLQGIWQRILDCARAGALASGTRMEFEQGTNYSNVLPNDTLTDVLSRAMQRAGGFEYTAEEKKFAEELKKSLDGPVRSPGPEKVTTDRSETVISASSDAGDVSWVVPTAQFTAATFVPGVGAHTWQSAACAGTSIGRKGMLVAARTLSLAATELFENPAEVKAAHDSFEKRLNGRKWTTQIKRDSKPPLDYATK